MMNIQGMSPSATSESRWKLPYIIGKYFSSANPSDPRIPIMAYTESWLKPYISDAQISIPEYNILRSDRLKRPRGGAILYIHESLPISEAETLDNDHCNVIVCTLESTNTNSS